MSNILLIVVGVHRVDITGRREVHDRCRRAGLVVVASEQEPRERRARLGAGDIRDHLRLRIIYVRLRLVLRE